MNNKEDINELLARYFANEPLTVAQRRELDEWMTAHKQEFEQMRKVMNASLKTTDEVVFDAEKAWQKIEPHLEERAKIIPFRQKARWVFSVAASLLLLLGIGAFYFFHSTSNEQMMRYANTGTTEKHVLLPDSSEVILYPEATLAYCFSGRQEGRRAELKGKAFFQVKKMHGRPFKVETDLLKVEVLGTSFLVDVAHRDKAGVFVKTGKVRVKEASAGEVVIEANEKAELKNGTWQTGVIRNPQSLFGEKERVLVFEQTPIVEVVRVVAEKTGIQIDLSKGLEKNLITTQIHIDEPDIAGELAFLCGCKCETLVKGKHYRLYEK